MDLESSRDAHAAQAERKRRHVAICVALMAAVVVVIIVVVILAFTVFKAKRPITTVDSVALKNIHFSLDIMNVSVKLNVTLAVDLTVRNPNRVAFKYTNSSGLLKYREEVVGEVPIPAGRLPSDGLKTMNLTLTVLADRLLSNSHIYADVLSGVVPMSSQTRISGRILILGLFKVKVVSSNSCDFLIFVVNRSLGDQQCKYKTKF